MAFLEGQTATPELPLGQHILRGGLPGGADDHARAAFGSAHSQGP